MLDENDSLPESLAEQAILKTTLLHNFPYQKGVAAEERNKSLIDPVIHVDSETCECNPTVMQWVEVWVRIFNPLTKHNEKKKVGRWVAKEKENDT